MPERIGRYRVTGQLGRGGMGVVFAAHDDELDRDVAVKMVRDQGSPQGRDRLRREAQAAAGVSHPGVCQVFEIGQHDGQLFIVMERLEGDSLQARLTRGPLPVAEAVDVALAVLGVLAALHARGLVHRDLKPSNVFLTPHGVKLLDFGLVAHSVSADRDTLEHLTADGAMVGTPAYMSPEQVTGGQVDARSDLFAVGILLYEALSGTTPFFGLSLMDVMRAVTERQPPALTGSPAIVAVDRVIHHALAKRPEHRYASADLMAADLRTAAALIESGQTDAPRRLRRLIVLPFRLLRPDTEIDFLSFALADAVAASLSGTGDLVVRSSAAAMRFAGEAPDLATLAREADVDQVVTGTLLRAGSQVRVNTQLVDVPVGTLVWSKTVQTATGDLFELQDELSARIVESLAAPLTQADYATRQRDAPVSAAAYEFYLRGNQLALSRADWPIAIDFYRRALKEDPGFAPAWAKLGRILRVTAKYGAGDPGPAYAEAEQALQRALAINPDLSIAHHYYAGYEAEAGRAADAIRRLLDRAKAHPAEPEAFAGLVHACRYGGLLEASAAAHERAKRLDPGIQTSVQFTHLAQGEWEKALGGDESGPAGGQQASAIHTHVFCLAMLGRPEEAAIVCRTRLPQESFPLFKLYGEALAATLEGQPATALDALTRLDLEGRYFSDPEGWFIWGCLWARLGKVKEALEHLDHAAQGYWCVRAYTHNPWLETVRGDPGFARVLEKVGSRHAGAVDAFVSGRGDVVLGVQGLE